MSRVTLSEIETNDLPDEILLLFVQSCALMLKLPTWKKKTPFSFCLRICLTRSTRHQLDYGMLHFFLFFSFFLFFFVTFSQFSGNATITSLFGCIVSLLYEHKSSLVFHLFRRTKATLCLTNSIRTIKPNLVQSWALPFLFYFVFFCLWEEKEWKRG